MDLILQYLISPFLQPDERSAIIFIFSDKKPKFRKFAFY